MTRFDNDKFIIIKAPFIKNNVLKDPKKWYALNAAFKMYYSGRTIRTSFGGR